MEKWPAIHTLDPHFFPVIIVCHIHGHCSPRKTVLHTGHPHFLKEIPPHSQESRDPAWVSFSHDTSSYESFVSAPHVEDVIVAASHSLVQALLNTIDPIG